MNVKTTAATIVLTAAGLITMTACGATGTVNGKDHVDSHYITVVSCTNDPMGKNPPVCGPKIQYVPEAWYLTVVQESGDRVQVEVTEDEQNNCERGAKYPECAN